MEIHRFQSHYDPELIGFGYVWMNGETKMYKMLSASGPLERMFRDMGELKEGDELTMGYDYDNNCFAIYGKWECVVVRVNVKTIIVRSKKSGKLRRLEV